MFGLEGSGFTISIGVTLLLVGLVVFYVKQRMDEWDNKLQGMLNLNKALAASHAALEQRVLNGVNYSNNVPVTDTTSVAQTPFDGSDVNNVADNRQVVSDDSSSESESDSDSDSDNDSVDAETTQMVIGSELDNNNDESKNDGIKVVELEGVGDNKQINLNEESLEEISLNTTTTDSQQLNAHDDEDEDEDNDDEDEDDEDEDDEDEDDDEDDSDDETEATELSTEDISNNVAELLNVKKVVTEVTAELDFKKLNVGKLRELVVTRSLADKGWS